MPSSEALDLSLGATLPGESLLLPGATLQDDGLLSFPATAKCSLKGSSHFVTAGSASETREGLESFGCSLVEASLDSSSALLRSSGQLLVGGSSSSTSLAATTGSLYAGLVRDTLESAVDAHADGGAEIVHEPDGHSSRSPEQQSGRHVDQMRKPDALTEEFYDEDSDEEAALAPTQPLPDSNQLASSLVSRASDLDASLNRSMDSLGYTQASSSCGGTMLTATLGLTGASTLNTSQGMDTMEALRAALTADARTPTPPTRDDGGCDEAANASDCGSKSIALQQGQFEAFTSAVKGAEGLDKDLQKDLLAILQNLPGPLPSR